MSSQSFQSPQPSNISEESTDRSNMPAIQPTEGSQTCPTGVAVASRAAQSDPSSERSTCLATPSSSTSPRMQPIEYTRTVGFRSVIWDDAATDTEGIRRDQADTHTSADPATSGNTSGTNITGTTQPNTRGDHTLALNAPSPIAPNFPSTTEPFEERISPTNITFPRPTPPHHTAFERYPGRSRRVRGRGRARRQGVPRTARTSVPSRGPHPNGSGNCPSFRKHW